MKRFILYNRSTIEQAPLQTYYRLISAPLKSIVRRQFISDIPLWIRMLASNFQENWNALLQTLEGHSSHLPIYLPEYYHSGSVNSIAFSTDGKYLASAS